MNTTHDCPACRMPGVPRSRLACPADWYRLPGPLRDAVWRGYRARPRDNGESHMAALTAALAWYRANPVPRWTP